MGQSAACDRGRAPGTDERETYALATEASDRRQWYFTLRTAATHAGYLLPHLRTGMRLLDCGCGPGSITVGLARAVTPGLTVGLDLVPQQFVQVRRLAAEHHADNLVGSVGNLYGLPFGDATFDVAHAHNVLGWLRDPFKAVLEMWRVLKPGGIVAICGEDVSTYDITPATPVLRQSWELFQRVRALNNVEPFSARQFRGILLEAGFARAESYGLAPEMYGTPERTRWYAAAMVEVLSQPSFVETATSRSWLDHATHEAMLEAWRTWGERPDAFCGALSCATIGWVGEDEGAAR